MTNKKKVKEKVYRYAVVVKCEKCGLVPEEIGPCQECKSETFVRVYQVVSD